MPRILYILIAVALGYLILCGVMYIFQRSFIYFPQGRSPGRGTETLTLPTEAGDVLVSVLRREGDKAVIYFGGNAEDVSGSLPDLMEAFPDRTIYLMHYRGYGGSAGRPSEEGLFADAITLFDLARATHPDIAVVGRSLGSGVAVYLAANRPASRLVLVTPFDSMAEIGARQFFFLPVRWLLLDKYASFRYAPNVTAPTTIIAAERDELIPAESAERLATRFTPGIATVHIIPGAGHNNISFNPAYLPLLSGEK